MSSSGTWRFLDGTKDGNASGNGWVDSGIAATEGGVYHFSIEIDPTTRTWVGGVNGWTSANSLGFQGTGTIGRQMEFSSTVNPGESVAFSLGAVSVIPEPGQLALVGLGGALIASAGWRRLRVA